MATVYFVREGTGERATDSGRDVSLDSITNFFQNTKLKWSQGPPTFGSREPANAVSDFKHVVVHVKDSETIGQFNKAGYWLLDGVSPSEFEQSIPRK